MVAPVSLKKVAFITGSSRGLGRAMALRLAKEGVAIIVSAANSDEAGKKVVEEIRAIDGEAIFCRCNVRDRDAVKKAVAAGIDAFGPINILINNAGWMVPLPFEQNDEAYWDRVLDTKIRGSLYTVHAVLPSMKECGWGKIINITGDAGRVGLTNGVVHTGAQGALQSMTKSWARELAKYGIRVNAVSPGPIESEQQKDVFATGGSQISNEINVGMFGVGKPDDIAAAVAFFVRNEADHITGQILSVNGGRAFPS